MLAMAAGTLLGCGDLAHTNPLDPESHPVITITGPTEIHSLGQQVTYSFTSVPEWRSKIPISWASSDGAVLYSIHGDERFMTLGNGTAEVQVTLGPHTGTLSVTVSQIATDVIVKSCDGRPAEITVLEHAYPLCAYVRDSVGSRVASQSVTLTSDDPATVEVRDTTAIAHRNGAVYVRATAGAWRDSLLVTVSATP
jgi:hypothetical protein